MQRALGFAGVVSVTSLEAGDQNDAKGLHSITACGEVTRWLVARIRGGDCRSFAYWLGSSTKRRNAYVRLPKSSCSRDSAMAPSNTKSDSRWRKPEHRRQCAEGHDSTETRHHTRALQSVHPLNLLKQTGRQARTVA